MGGRYNLEIDETTAQMSTVINQTYLEFLNCLSLTPGLLVNCEHPSVLSPANICLDKVHVYLQIFPLAKYIYLPVVFLVKYLYFSLMM